jgi:phage-related protein
LGLGIDKATLASGDFAKIQAEIQSKVGGTASTVAGTATGSFARLTVAVDEAKESIGAGLLPFIGPLADSLARLAPIIAENSELILGIGAVVGALSVAIIALKFALIATNAIMVITTTIGAALKIGYLTLAAATGSATAAQTLAELTYKKSIVALVAYNVAMAAQSAITGVVTAAQYALNLALSLNPIGLVVIAVAALGAAFVLAYKKIEPFRDLMDSIFQKIKNIGTAIKESPVGQAIAKAFEGFRAAGGPVRQGKSYIVGEAGPELFTANTSGAISPSGSFGGGGGVNITINGAIDPEGVRRSLETLFQNSARRTGPVNFAGARL